MNSDTNPPGRIPRSTYRLQLNHGFRFDDAREWVPYLAELGISDLYASPYLQARSGSLHGYDISNHNALNAEIGSLDDHAALIEALRVNGMGHLLDIVPNHMGIGEGENRWWMDVLENGPSSAYAPYFDIEWKPVQPELEGKVLLPVLGDQFGKVLENGELQLRYEGDHFRLEYHEHRFPVAPRSLANVLRDAWQSLEGSLPEDHPDRMELGSIATALDHLPPRHHTDSHSVAERRREKAVSERRLAHLYGSSEDLRQAIDGAVERVNGRRGVPASFGRLEELLDDQAYRLAFWRVAAEEINYRRFFDINDLVGLRVERSEVFEAVHRLIFRLLEEGKVTGLRIDHPDGLYDPPEYLRNLQNALAQRLPNPPGYVVVEKILTGPEALPDDWPVAGTVGYEFLNLLNGLFVDGRNEAVMSAIYAGFTGRMPNFTDLVYEKKRLILRVSMASELTVLATMLNRLAERNRCFRDFTFGSLRDALRETIASFPIYRTYIDAQSGRVTERDHGYIDQSVRRAKRRNPSTDVSVFDFIHDLLLLRWPGDLDEAAREEHESFVMKFQQITGPVMAKGVEDTSFYIFNRLISLNEVGGEPDRFGIPVDEFHRQMMERAEKWPHALSSTSTHDTKRSEDIRARIDVLSELPNEWEGRVKRWAAANERHRIEEEGVVIPDPNDEYLLYQTLVGVWPLYEMDGSDYAELVGRVQAYMEKASREAKVHTSWINPNEVYDDGLRDFVGKVLDRSVRNEFLDDFTEFQRQIARSGMVNSLSQTLLKITAPGVPDIYQGQELWDFSLVDPDNRRPVNFGRARELLRDLRGRWDDGERDGLVSEVLENWRDGRIKLWLTHRALMLRNEHPELFARGEYLPLRVTGPRAEHVVAFARRWQDRIVLVVVPRLAQFAGAGQGGWGDTYMEGGILRGTLRNVLTGSEVPVGDQRLQLAESLTDFPVGLFIGSTLA